MGVATKFCHFSRTIQDFIADEKTPHERPHETPFDGPLIHFGAESTFYPLSTIDRIRLHHFSCEVLHGVFMGHALSAGRGRTQDLLISDAAELKHNGSSEVYIQRYKEKEVEVKKIEGHLYSLVQAVQ